MASERDPTTRDGGIARLATVTREVIERHGALANLKSHGTIPVVGSKATGLASSECRRERLAILE